MPNDRAHLLIIGDRVKASEWVGYARSKMRDLRRRGGVSKTLRPRPFIVISLTRWGDNYEQIIIRADKKPGCVALDSGLRVALNKPKFYAKYPALIPIQNIYKTDPAQVEVADADSLPSEGDEVKISTPTGMVELDKRTFTATGPTQDLGTGFPGFMLDGENATTHSDFTSGYYENLSGYFKSTPTVLPYSSSDFTGVMHAHAQILMGHPSANTVFDPNGSGFKADWSETFGIYIQEIKDAYGATIKKKPWFVRINSSGVFVKKAPHCSVKAGYTAPTKPSPTTKKWDSQKFMEKYLNYPNKVKEEFFDITDWTNLFDADASEGKDKLDDFYSLSPVYARCGWAFNSTGTKAVNTGYEYVVGANGTRGYKFHEYIISIAAGDDNEPVSTLVLKNTSGYAKQIWNGASPAPARLVIPDTSGILTKFDLALSDTLNSVYGSDGEEAPLISWYDSTDTLTGLIHINQVTSSSGSSYWDDQSTEELPSGSITKTIGTEEIGISGGVTYKGESLDAYYLRDGTIYTYYCYPRDKDARTTGSYAHPAENLWDVGYTRHNNATGSSLYENVGIIPVGARASAYQYTLETTRLVGTYYAGRRFVMIAGPTHSEGEVWHRWKQKYHTAVSWCSGGNLTCNGNSAWAWYYPDNINESFVATDPRKWWCAYAAINANGVSLANSMEQYEAHSLEVCCTVWTPNCRIETGWCPGEFSAVDPINSHIPSSSYDCEETRIETLRFKDSATNTSTTVFSNTEGPLSTCDGDTFSAVLTPYEGNKYAFKYWNGQRMYCWSDPITNQIVYSNVYNGDSGTGLTYTADAIYPITEIPATVMHSWIGIPGDIT